MKLLGIDWGQRRLGIAMSDDGGTFAFEHHVLDNWNTDDFIEYLRQLIAYERIDRIVGGLPINTQGEDTASTEQVREFAATIENCLNIPIDFEDERFTTQMADATFREMGISQRDARGRKDMLAAKYLLQSYIDRKNHEEE